MADPIEVPFSDDVAEVRDDELIVEADKPGDTPEVKAQRAARRKERAQERERERKQQSEELAQLKQEIATERAERARLQGYVQALPAAQAPPGKDPYEAALDGVYERRANAYQAMQAEMAAGKLDEKRSKHFERESREIEGEIARIHSQRAVDSDRARQRQEAAQQPYIHKYPEVYNNGPAFRYAQAEFAKRSARAEARGERLPNDVVEEIMEETRTEFKLGKKAAPSRSEKDRYTGGSAGGTGGGNGGGGSHGIAMTKELRSMAIARYGGQGVSDEAAVAKWVNAEGKALRAQKVL